MLTKLRLLTYDLASAALTSLVAQFVIVVRYFNLKIDQTIVNIFLPGKEFDQLVELSSDELF